MAGPIYAARMAKKRHRKPGNLYDLLAMLWRALIEAQGVLDRASDDETELKLKAVHAISQAGGQYAKLLGIGELEAQLSALEQQMQGGP